VTAISNSPLRTSVNKFSLVFLEATLLNRNKMKNADKMVPVTINIFFIFPLSELFAFSFIYGANL
jgi:hypothetical protein